MAGVILALVPQGLPPLWRSEGPGGPSGAVGSSAPLSSRGVAELSRGHLSMASAKLSLSAQNI